MFLVGGPAFSGTTLLALMLNQANIVCLDEPDFHSLSQCHRSIPVLRTMFPNTRFPDHPLRDLAFYEAVQLIHECESALGSYELGIKTCDRVFLEYAEVYRQRAWPVIGIFRDIRDALVRRLEDGSRRKVSTKTIGLFGSTETSSMFGCATRTSSTNPIARSRASQQF